MKMKWMLMLFTIAGIAACSAHDFDLQNPNPREFVSLLKRGTYVEQVGYELPNFSMADIEELANYLSDTTRINEFPTNPISSKVTHPKILNECIMWTMEGIRLGEKCPSLEPCLRNTSDQYARLTNAELVELGMQYDAWYQEYKTTPSEGVRKKGLLENIPYQWN